MVGINNNFCEDKRRMKEDEEPRLEFLPQNQESILISFKWIEFMLSKVGHAELEDLLDYYVDLGWISEDVLMEILKISSGFRVYKEDNFDPPEYITEEEGDRKPEKLISSKDHIKSFMYIEKLRDKKLDSKRIDKACRDLKFIDRKIDEIDGF